MKLEIKTFFTARIITIMAVIGAINSFVIIGYYGELETIDIIILVIEISIGSIIATVIFKISKLSEIEMQEIVDETLHKVKSLIGTDEKRTEFVIKKLYKQLIEMKANIDEIETLTKQHNNRVIDEQSRLKLNSNYKNMTNFQMNDNDNMILNAELDDENIQKLSNVYLLAGRYSDRSDKNPADISVAKQIIDMINPLIEILNKKLQDSKKKNLLPTNKPQLSKSKSTVKLKFDKSQITSSIDRTLYPPNSIIYARANLKEIIKNAHINFELLTSKQIVIDSSSIDPTKYDDLKLKESNIFQVMFQMKGQKWKVGETYYMRSSHNGFYHEKSFMIDERTPIILSDKPVYVMGTDVLITIIDLDADRDSNRVEYIGDRKDSMLVIESPYMKIDGYRLKETGKSTGIFQGKIRILERESDSVSIPKKDDERPITNTQRFKIEDGFISGSFGDRLIARYTNKTSTIEHDFFISDSRTEIELDKNVYSWTDKVYITVIDPGLIGNIDSIERKDKSNYCVITASTSQGILNKYKLVETEKDSGIFAGEIILTGFPDHNIKHGEAVKGETYGTGPTDGKIGCLNKDTLTVTLVTPTKIISNDASIMWNIGDIDWHKPSYSVYEKGTIRIIDPDMNLDPEMNDEFEIRVWSDADPKGIVINVREIGKSTGIFTGDVKFSTNKPSSTPTLRVSEGDHITAEYIDQTLPDPYSKNDSVIIGSTSIIDTRSHLPKQFERLSVVNPRILDHNENMVKKSHINQVIKIVVDLTNTLDMVQKFMYIAQIFNTDTQEERLLPATYVTLSPYQSRTVSIPWKPTNIGTYDVSIFVWKSLDNPIALSPKLELKITIENT